MAELHKAKLKAQEEGVEFVREFDRGLTEWAGCFWACYPSVPYRLLCHDGLPDSRRKSLTSCPLYGHPLPCPASLNIHAHPYLRPPYVAADPNRRIDIELFESGKEIMELLRSKHSALALALENILQVGGPFGRGGRNHVNLNLAGGGATM